MESPSTRTRPYRPKDAPRVADWLSRLHPEAAVTAADLERRDAGRLAGEPFARTLIERSGELIGFWEVGVPRLDGHPGWLEVLVRSADPGAAGAWLKDAEAFARTQGARLFVARVQDGWNEVTLYQAHGYAEHDRMQRSVLDLTRLDFTRFAGYERRAREAGVTLSALSDLGPFDEAAQWRLYDLIAALLRDVPSTTPVSVWPFEVWQARFLKELNRPDLLFVALSPTGEWIGLSDLGRVIPASPGRLGTGLTGVRSDWRGVGAAYALKLATFRRALELGFREAVTGNHTRNAPMLAINRALGFEAEAALITLTKKA